MGILGSSGVFMVILGCLVPMLFIEDCQDTIFDEYWHVSYF